MKIVHTQREEERVKKYRNMTLVLVAFFMATTCCVCAFAESGAIPSDNYVFDLETQSLFGAGNVMLNSLLNSVFSFGKTIANTAIDVYAYGQKFEISQIFANGEIDKIQNGLQDNIFMPFAVLIIAIGSFIFASAIAKRNYNAAFMHIAQSVLIVAGALALAGNSTILVENISKITTEIGMSVTSSLSKTEGESTEDAAKNALFQSLIHRPYIEISRMGTGTGASGEFKLTEDDVTKVLAMDNDVKENSERQIRVDKLAETTGGFSSAHISQKLGTVLVYLIFLFIKSAMYAFFGIVPIFFQAITALMFILGSLVLLCSLSPQLGGVQMIWVWLKKIIEIQVYSVLANLFMGFILLIDTAFYSVDGIGFLTASLLQVLMVVVLFLFRDHILGIFQVVGMSVQTNGAAMRQGLMNVSPIALSEKRQREMTKDARDQRKQFKEVAVTTGKTISSTGRAAATTTVGAIGMAASAAAAPILSPINKGIDYIESKVAPVTRTADYAGRRLDTYQKNRKYEQQQKTFAATQETMAISREKEKREKQQQLLLDKSLDARLKSFSPTIAEKAIVNHEQRDIGNKIKRNRQIRKAQQAKYTLAQDYKKDNIIDLSSAFQSGAASSSFAEISQDKAKEERPIIISEVSSLQGTDRHKPQRIEKPTLQKPVSARSYSGKAQEVETKPLSQIKIQGSLQPAAATTATKRARPTLSDFAAEKAKKQSKDSKTAEQKQTVGQQLSRNAQLQRKGGAKK